MPKGSFADTSLDWESLQAACLANARELSAVEPFAQALSAIQTEVRETKALQEDLEGKRQGTTQRLNEAVKRGEEAARRLRGYVKARIGTNTEFLVQFGIAPIRPLKGRRKSPAPPVPPPPAEPGAVKE
jgi:hypothetical protein